MRIRTNASEELIEVMEWIKISSVIVAIWILYSSSWFLMGLLSEVYKHWWG
tara:strand:+ start:60 stop:212 length:153 start_codon:yes stop_codon:yes gene_type:complete